MSIFQIPSYPQQYKMIYFINTRAIDQMFLEEINLQVHISKRYISTFLRIDFFLAADIREIANGIFLVGILRNIIPYVLCLILGTYIFFYIHLIRQQIDLIFAFLLNWRPCDMIFSFLLVLRRFTVGKVILTVWSILKSLQQMSFIT